MVVSVLVLLVWYITGCIGFVFWWTSRNDLIADLNTIVTVLLAGIFGPLMFLIGFIIYSPKMHRVIMKRRITRK